jgi:hypothetical protein
MRLCLRLLITWLLVVAAVRADEVGQLLEIHADVLGGREAISALKALRATGFVVTGGATVKFTLVAARPNRLRLETVTGDGRSLVQACDGGEAPWKFDASGPPPHYKAMAEAEGRVFAADAEFDDPLVAGAERGFVFDNAGEMRVGERKMLRILVTRKLVETYAILVDAESYLIFARIEQRKTSASGRTVDVVTRYEDYRPVAGVLVPHKIAVLIDGKITQKTLVDKIEANPPVSTGTFSRPPLEMPDTKAPDDKSPDAKVPDPKALETKTP